jgi:hypothetical protein
MDKSPFRHVMQHIPKWIKIAKENPSPISFGCMTHNYIAFMRNYYDITREHHDMTPPCLMNIFLELTRLNPTQAIRWYDVVKEEILECLQESLDEENDNGAYGCGEWAKNLRKDIYQMIELCKLINKRKCCICRCPECKKKQKFGK